jgi:phosphohistidine phosphatase
VTGDPGAVDPGAGGRRLVLLRHAKSDWPDVADHDRPLAKRGRRDAPVVGRWLGQAGYVPDAVVCSTALRARETWELAAGGLLAAVPGASPAVRHEPRVYDASVLGLLMLVREFAPEWRTALVVGHNPGMAELTVGLTDPPPEPPAAFPTAAVAVLALPGPWSDAGPGQARLLAFAVPADMHSLFARGQVSLRLDHPDCALCRYDLCTAYRFSVIAIRGNKQSKPSSALTVTTPTPPLSDAVLRLLS